MSNTQNTPQSTHTDVKFTPIESDTSSYKYYPDTPEDTLSRFTFSSKDPSKYFDPCKESADMSFKCLDRNNFNRALCQEYFDVYRDCKKQWLRSRRQNRSQWE